MTDLILHIWFLYENRFVGAGGVSFFLSNADLPQSKWNKAYIMNMYTNPEYRRLGIAYKTLDMLIRDTKRQGHYSYFIRSN